VCRVCTPDALETISMMPLRDFDDADRFIMLSDCGHVFEREGLDRWMAMQDLAAPRGGGGGGGGADGGGAHGGGAHGGGAHGGGAHADGGGAHADGGGAHGGGADGDAADGDAPAARRLQLPPCPGCKAPIRRSFR
jgi:hypothetical protein